MKLLVMIACLLLATNIYADQTKDKDTGGNNAQQETKDADGNYVQKKATEAPGWASANGDPALSEDRSGQPSYRDVREPSFGHDRDDQ